MLTTIVIFILILSLLVLVHELGHFLTAKKLGVKSEEFGFGFPPRIFGLYKNNNGKWSFVKGSKEVKDASDTIYSLNLIPLGGFVKIKGENGEEKEDQDSFASKAIWKRSAILSAGVIMNIVLAFVLISIGLMIGLPHQIDGKIDKRAQLSDMSVQVTQVFPDTPAESAGIKIGDTIFSLNSNKIDSVDKLVMLTKGKSGSALDYKIKRGDKFLDLTITPVIMKESGKDGIGIAIAEIGLVKYPWYLAIWKGLESTLILTWSILVAFFELIKNLIVGNSVSAEVGGPVKIAALTGQFAQLGFAYLLQFTALLSINLAIINFLPFPALDGGRILFLIIEKIKGTPVKKEIEGMVHTVGFVLLMILIVIVTYNDIVGALSK